MSDHASIVELKGESDVKDPSSVEKPSEAEGDLKWITEVKGTTTLTAHAIG